MSGLAKAQKALDTAGLAFARHPSKKTVDALKSAAKAFAQAVGRYAVAKRTENAERPACAACGKPMPVAPTGRPRKTCSPACYRAVRRGEMSA